MLIYLLLGNLYLSETGHQLTSGLGLGVSLLVDLAPFVSNSRVFAQKQISGIYPGPSFEFIRDLWG